MSKWPPKKMFRKTKPKARHPGRAYPKPKGKLGKVGRGGKVPAQHPSDQRKKFPADWTKRARYMP